jgi:hypothetical protein
VKFLKKLFASKEVLAAIGVLDEFEYSCNSPAFQLIREEVESAILEQAERFISVIKEQDRTPRQKVYSMMEHVAGDYLESGSLDFFVYRGLLNFCGEELLRIYDLIIDRMREINCISDEEARKQKSDIRDCIKRAC